MEAVVEQNAHFPFYKCELHFLHQGHFLEKDPSMLHQAHSMLGILCTETFSVQLEPSLN